MIVFTLMIGMTIVVDAADSSFTQADRERLVRLEEGLKATNQKIDDGLKATNQRMDDGFKATSQRIDDLRGLIYVMISVTISGMLFIVGFALWDRRTILAPLAATVKELETRTGKLELAIKEKADKDPELKEALKHAGLL
ncbi:MAG: hypothetical protein HQL05_05780 [Nitrospirae bacterium]|uniref:hypothetical protein n=1 Tax=Candidatus Magnetobacterium casense TaxID=1455061 RepID=UPI00059108B1|nr:hypothetical protein [Candidatus Magnetobacterium casensis]MBF0337323.1 hypothetical protein [Nitrospirota bacterium]